MHFQIKRRKAFSFTAPGGEREYYTWQMEAADGEILCQSGQWWNTEAQARSNVARVKTPMKGATRYKVVSPNE